MPALFAVALLVAPPVGAAEADAAQVEAVAPGNAVTPTDTESGSAAGAPTNVPPNIVRATDEATPSAAPGNNEISETADGGLGDAADSELDALSTWNEGAPPLQRLDTLSPLEDAALRDAAIAAAAPPAPDVVPWIPPNVQARVSKRLAFLLDSLGDTDAALAHFARTLSLAPPDPVIWRRLAHSRVQSGDLDGARNALFASIDVARGNATALARAHGDLAELALLEDRPRHAMLALDIALSHAPHHSHLQALRSRALHELHPEDGAKPETPAPLRIASSPTRLHERVGTRVARLESQLPPATRKLLHDATERLREPATEAILWVAFFVLSLAWAVARIARGRGDLCVAIDYPSELRGTFTVRLQRRPTGDKRKRARRHVSADVLRGAASSSTEHTLVSRETHFRRLRPGRYWIAVEGLLHAHDNEEVLAELIEERQAVVRGRRAVRVEFDVRPNECPVDVTVLWDKRPAKDAGVVALGVPGSLRYSKGGPVRLALERGKHRVAIGSGDRVAVVKIDVDSYQPKAVQVDLAGSEDVVFKGCPPAVELYLHSDIPGAARALEREGQKEQGSLLLAGLYREHGRVDLAAEHFETAKAWLEAAELQAELENWERAAPLFEQAGDTVRAAEMHQRSGAWEDAGAAFEKARDFDAAVECYREANAVTRWIDALERSGRVFEASVVALERTERRRAIRLLQQVLPEDPRFEDAATKLAAVLEEEGHVDLAAQKLEEYVRAAGTSANPDLQFHLSELYEESGEIERSISVLEELRRCDPTYPNLATRIETLRKRRSSGMDSRSGSRSTGSLQTTAPLMGESRYEVLEEVGRGGMGVVYRAQDKRLNREVALKRMPKNLREHPKAVQYFLREAQAVARLNHRNVVTVFDVDQEENVFFITMELLKGHPLNTVLKKKGKIGARDVAKLGIQVAAGLAYAHDQGVIHRDIKTANLFLTTDKTVTIMDFGLAKMVEEVRKGSTIIGGTPFYMAPEQAVGDHVDHRADLYALGVTLFELATGNVPFEEGDVTYHHRHTAPPDPRTLVEGIPDDMAELILELMQKTAENRPADAHVVRERLERIVRAGR